MTAASASTAARTGGSRPQSPSWGQTIVLTPWLSAEVPLSRTFLPGPSTGVRLLVPMVATRGGTMPMLWARFDNRKIVFMDQRAQETMHFWGRH
jgi:hypothetical protein